MAARPPDVVPVPAAVFGPLLERVTDAATLRCALRAIFVLHRKQTAPGRGRGPSTVTAEELGADPVLGLGGGEAADGPTVAEGALASLAELGVLVRAERGYALDTPGNRRALAADAGWRDGWGDGPGPWDPAPTLPRPNLFQLYEENIGVITPMAAERLKEMEKEYPAEWIAEAFEEAVRSNARSLRYVEAVLRRWRDHGRGDGKPRGRAGTVSSREIFRRGRQ